jgi:putative transposase
MDVKLLLKAKEKTIMTEFELLKLLGQVKIGDAAATFRDFMRGAARDLVLRVMTSEVEMLCGPAYHPSESSGCFRAGSAPGSVLIEERGEPVNRPRVRKHQQGGGSVETDLSSYQAAREPGALHEMLLRSLIGGVSTREQCRVHPDSPNVSKSSISRLFTREGARIFEEFRQRDIAREDWLVLMLDGVRLAHELWAVVALGVAEDGTKQMLDFEVGASENAQVTTALTSRLAQRGFGPKAGCRLLCVFDGSKALRKATKKLWPRAIFQRCLVHKERNLRRYLAKRDWGSLAQLMQRIRKAQGEEDGRKALDELQDFAAARNAQALASLKEAGDELIALHLLEVPNTLHRSLLSTNAIENSIRNIRGKIGRVTRWRPETDQPCRWLAMALTEIEKGFRKLAGYRDLPALALALVDGDDAQEAALAA